MRASKLLLSLLGATLVATLAPPVHAAAPPESRTFAVVDPDDQGIARVVVLCTGQAPPADSALTVVACDLYDSSGRPSIHHERGFAGPAGVCVINAFNMVIPVEYCTTTTTTYRDLSKQSTTQCGHAGGAPPPHNAPGPYTPNVLECLDAVGVPLPN